MQYNTFKQTNDHLVNYLVIIVVIVIGEANKTPLSQKSKNFFHLLIYVAPHFNSTDNVIKRAELTVCQF